MGNTVISIQGQHFFINGQKTYAEIPGSPAAVQGLLMNARFIQGIFDDRVDPSRFNRFGRIFDPEQNTNDLIAALPQWQAYGLRALTVGLQGGGPCFTTDNKTIDNNPYGADGLKIDPAYLGRLDRLIRAADAIGMVIIVSFLYPGQLPRLQDDKAVENAVRSAARFLRDQAYGNVLIEVCNEMDIDKAHPIVHQPAGMVGLINLARQESGGLLTSCSCAGGVSFPEISQASDFILIHGNGCTRQQLNNLISKVRSESPGKPVICNEDSSAIGQLQVAFDTQSSWGYYNNITKQEPPADWSVNPGEDHFFAVRMATGLGIACEKVAEADQYLLQYHDLAERSIYWLRLAALYPEKIDRVEFFLNGNKVYTCYDEPYMLNYCVNFFQLPWHRQSAAERWTAHIHLHNGQLIEKSITI